MINLKLPHQHCRKRYRFDLPQIHLNQFPKDFSSFLLFQLQKRKQKVIKNACFNLISLFFFYLPFLVGDPLTLLVALPGADFSFLGLVSFFSGVNPNFSPSDLKFKNKFFIIIYSGVISQGLLKCSQTVQTEQKLQSCLKLRNFQNPFCHILETLNKNYDTKDCDNVFIQFKFIVPQSLLQSQQ